MPDGGCTLSGLRIASLIGRIRCTSISIRHSDLVGSGSSMLAMTRDEPKDKAHHEHHGIQSVRSL